MSAQIDDDTLEWIERELTRCVILTTIPLSDYVLAPYEMYVLVHARLVPPEGFKARRW